MSIAEELLAKAKGNKVRAATELVIGVMAGDPETFKLGYSIGNALMAAIAHYNLTAREVALVVEELPERLTDHHSATKRPLVIVHVGGGMVQWTHEKPGLGTPEVHVLDFDKEGASDEELVTFLGEIDAALQALDAYGPAASEYERDVRYTLGLARNEYQDHIDEGTKPSRYR